MTRRRASALVAGCLAAVALVAAVAGLAVSRSGDPSRCPAGMVALGPRCCGEGQQLEQTEDGPRCVGSPSACARGLEVTAGGCVAPDTRVELPAGTLRIGPGDWEAAGIEPREAAMATFAIDAYEVTEARWRRCVDAGSCAASTAGAQAAEPGLPVTRRNRREAEAFCAWAGGRLASANELAWAAAGARGRRYPWGDTGAVCRRAAWGLLAGPCARDARGPDVAGSRPDGASPEGVFDLAGNVAEWARGEGGERAEVRGGAFPDEAAARLRSWNRREEPADLRSPEVGFRCTYAASPGTP
jgi:formylglycine-generating enzyme required for sulfatase activity